MHGQPHIRFIWHCLLLSVTTTTSPNTQQKGHHALVFCVYNVATWITYIYIFEDICKFSCMHCRGSESDIAGCKREQGNGTLECWSELRDGELCGLWSCSEWRVSWERRRNDTLTGNNSAADSVRQLREKKGAEVFGCWQGHILVRCRMTHVSKLERGIVTFTEKTNFDSSKDENKTDELLPELYLNIQFVPHSRHFPSSL